MAKLNKIDKNYPRYIIGFDIGGSKITGIVFDGRKIVKDLTVATPKNLKGFTKQMKQLVAFLSASKIIKTVGVGIPGGVDKAGRVIYAPNMKFLVGFNLNKFCRALGLRKIKIENDANCFALAEARLGQGRNLKNFVGITLGTGIGGGLISNGRLYSGMHGSAGEVGHMMADEKQTYEFYFQRRCRAKNYHALGKLLGRMFADVYNLLDVGVIVLSGSVVKSASQFLPSALGEARRHILNRQIKPKILVSRLKNAGALGAALLCEL